MRSHLVAVVAYDDLCTFEFGCAVEIFSVRWRGIDMPWYNFGVCAATRSPLRAAGGVRFTAPHPLRLLDRAGLCEGKQPGTHLFPLAQARQALTNACKRLGYPHFTQRSLRRMFITRAIEKGVDVIAEWQNHKDGGKLLLDTYSHVRPEHSNRMAQLMSDEAPANVVPMHQAS